MYAPNRTCSMASRFQHGNLVIFRTSLGGIANITDLAKRSPTIPRFLYLTLVTPLLSIDRTSESSHNLLPKAADMLWGIPEDPPANQKKFALIFQSTVTIPQNEEILFIRSPAVTLSCNSKNAFKSGWCLSINSANVSVSQPSSAV